MTQEDPTPERIARLYLAWDDHSAGLGPEPAGSRKLLRVWEDWTASAPDKAWAVFEEIVRLRPEDDEVLAGIWSQFEWLLEHHADHYYPRIVAMVGSQPRLTRIAPWQCLRRDYFAPNYFTPSELAAVWLVHSDSASDANELDSVTRDDPDHALTLAMEIIHRGSGYRFSAYDLMSPLHDLLRRPGSHRPGREGGRGLSCRSARSLVHAAPTTRPPKSI
jgi:hypothetical protein